MTPSVTRKVPPHTYEAHDPMPEEYRQLVIRLIKETGEFGSTKGMQDFLRTLVTRVIDWAPDLASRVRVADFYADETRHSFIMEGLLRQLGVDPVKEFGDGFLTSIEGLHLLLTEINCWTDFALCTCLLDRAASYQFGTYAECSYAPMARVGPRMQHDERGHAAMGLIHLKAICRTEEGRKEAQELLYKWYPVALDMFGTSTGKRQWQYLEWGLKSHSNEELRQMYLKEVVPLLQEVGLEPPDERYGRKFL